MEFNLADLFECVADRVPDREAVVWRDRRLTFAQLDERAQFRKQGRDFRRQHRTHLHIRDKAGLFLVKADQHAAFLGHVAHGQSRPLAISPGGAVDRR